MFSLLAEFRLKPRVEGLASQCFKKGGNCDLEGGTATEAGTERNIGIDQKGESRNRNARLFHQNHHPANIGGPIHPTWSLGSSVTLQQTPLLMKRAEDLDAGVISGTPKGNSHPIDGHGQDESAAVIHMIAHEVNPTGGSSCELGLSAKSGLKLFDGVVHVQWI